MKPRQILALIEFIPTSHFEGRLSSLPRCLPIATGLAARIEILSRNVSRLIEMNAVSISHSLHSTKGLQRNKNYAQCIYLAGPT